MKLFLSALFVAGSLGLACADDVKKKSVAEQVKEMDADLLKKNSEMRKKLNEAKDNEEKQTLMKGFRDELSKTAETALALAKDNPKDDGAMDAVMLVMKTGVPDATKQARELLFESFGDNPKIVGLVPMLSQTPDGKAKLAKLGETSKNRTVKGGVLFALAEAELQDADYPRGQPRKAEETAKLVTAASDKLSAVLKEYGDVTVPVAGAKGGTQTLAKAGEKAKFFAENLTLGKTAPEIDGELLDGKKAKLSDYRGKVVVVDVWATWCPPCRAMIPHERELVEKMKDKPFVLLSVSADEKKETLTKFLDEEKMPWTHWWVGNKGGLVEKFQIRFYPTIYVLDAKGVIRFKHVRGPAMDAAVEELLKEATKTGA